SQRARTHVRHRQSSFLFLGEEAVARSRRTRGVRDAASESPHTRRGRQRQHVRICVDRGGEEELMAVATAPTMLRESQRDLNRRHRLLIDGEWVEPASGRTFPTVNPATGETLAEIASGEAEDINRAVAAARRAFDSGPWPRMTPADRQRMIWRLADLIEA